MDLIRKASAKASELHHRSMSFCAQTLQWRLSTASCIYVIIANSLYWTFVFCADMYYQRWLLDALTMFLTSELLIIPLFSVYHPLLKLLDYRRPEGAVKERPASEYSNSRSLLKQVFRVIIMAPFNNLICPLLRLVQYIISNKTVKVFILAACFEIKILIARFEEDKACLLAYAAVLLVLVSPPWKYYQVNQKIIGTISGCLSSIKSLFVTKLARPTFYFVFKFSYCLRYVFCGWWLLPLIAWFRRSVVDPLWQGCTSCCVLLKYYACGGWIPSVKHRLFFLYTGFVSFVNYRIACPVVALCCSVKIWLVYIITLRWLIDLVHLCLESLKAAYRKRCLPRLHQCSAAVISVWWTVYYVCSGMWLVTVVRRCQQLSRAYSTHVVTALLRAAKYTFYGIWFVDLCMYINASILSLVSRMHQQLLMPLSLAVEAHLYSLGHRTVILSKTTLLQLKVFFFYRLLLPGFYSTILSIFLILQAIYASVLAPLSLMIFDAVKRFWLSSGRDAMQKVVAVLPERSFFVEDSDSELKDFLPDEAEEANSGSRRSSVSSSSSKSIYDYLTETRSLPTSNEVKSSNRSSVEFEREYSIAVSESETSYSDEEDAELRLLSSSSKQASLKSVSFNGGSDMRENSQVSPSSTDSLFNMEFQEEMTPIGSSSLNPRSIFSSSSESALNNCSRKKSSGGADNSSLSHGAFLQQSGSFDVKLDPRNQEIDGTVHSDFELLEPDSDSSSNSS
ncbi:unnamed protein product [Soboliphyme baturini]|uniref:RING-type domain-containing protein n=1 Tax=Soboliphyme baturini TaxID=241478 RepID=A0A183IIE0_9BILA|nr:unnamed protein product [Soboliphyme baturini]